MVERSTGVHAGRSILRLFADTTTAKGLKVACRLDRCRHPTTGHQVALTSAATVAAAVTIYGWVGGHVDFFQNQGGWCPSLASFVGNTYLQSESSRFQPFMEAKVVIIDKTTGAQIGETVTDSNGNYLAQWATRQQSSGQATIEAIVIS